MTLFAQATPYESHPYLPGLLSVLVVVISAGLSLVTAILVSRDQARRTFANLSVELREKYSNALFAKRLDVYPSLYRIVSDLAKTISDRTLTSNEVGEALGALKDWDSKNAIYTSPATQMVLGNIRDILAQYRESPPGAPIDSDAMQNIRRACARIENALRKELGIFDVTDFHQPEEQ
jgi:hypothetical protein